MRDDGSQVSGDNVHEAADTQQVSKLRDLSLVPTPAPLGANNGSDGSPMKNGRAWKGGEPQGGLL